MERDWEEAVGDEEDEDLGAIAAEDAEQIIELDDDGAFFKVFKARTKSVLGQPILDAVGCAAANGNQLCTLSLIQCLLSFPI